MDMKLELVPVPVSDVDRAKAFYVDKVGFVADHDTTFGDTARLQRSRRQHVGAPGNAGEDPRQFLKRD